MYFGRIRYNIMTDSNEAKPVWSSPTLHPRLHAPPGVLQTVYETKRNLLALPQLVSSMVLLSRNHIERRLSSAIFVHAEPIEQYNAGL
jgi:hypothetical protein